MQQTPIRHKPPTLYLRTLLYMFIALFLRVVALAPLAFLLVFPHGSPARYLALLCPALLIFLVLPLRYSFAEALVQKPGRRWFSFDAALSMSGYGEKLAEALLHALNVLKWGVPLFLIAGYDYYFYKTTDAFGLIEQISGLGQGVINLWCAVANFFITLFGGAHTLTSNGALMEGVYVLLAALGAGALIWAYGAVRNSGARYIWVAATRGERSPRTETRRRLRGRRWTQLGVGLVNLALWSPFLIVFCTSLKDVVGGMSTQLMLMIAQSRMPALDLFKTVGPLLFAFFFLYMPLLPVRRWLTAAFATRDLRRAAPKTDHEKTAQGAPASTSPSLASAVPDAADAAAVPAREAPAVAEEGASAWEPMGEEPSFSQNADAASGEEAVPDEERPAGGESPEDGRAFTLGQ